MSQLIIKDLSFCEQELSTRQKSEVSGSFFDFDFDAAWDSVFDNAGAFAVGFTFLIFNISSAFSIIRTIDYS